MPVWICWPTARGKHISPGPSFTIRDAYQRSWTCCVMRHEAVEPAEDSESEGIDTDRPAIPGGSDVVIVSADDKADLADLLARGIRFVGFPLPLADANEADARCPMPSDN